MEEKTSFSKENLILTAVGPDRVGLVETISEFVFTHGCNIEDSKMAVFCGEFALILLVSGESQALQGVAQGCRELEAQTGLSISVKIAAPRKPVGASLPYTLSASCMDHPGVVYRLSGILSHFGINIESMETKTYAAPITGTPIFRLEAQISVPAKLQLHALRDRLEAFAREENIELSLVAAAQ
ncbi:MAG: glycine cleavage system protein R [Deltaproteobacteria bacterium]|nr:glycine cleavage system protein R [Deltaproteobacteria bacterium]